MTTRTSTHRSTIRRSIAGSLISAGALMTLTGVAGNSAAAPGDTAVALGPYASAQQCQLTADRIIRYGAKRFGPKFGTCYQAHNGQWFVISPWSA